MSSSSSARMGAPSTSHPSEVPEEWVDLERIYQHMLREAISRRKADREKSQLMPISKPSTANSSKLQPLPPQDGGRSGSRRQQACTMELPPLVTDSGVESKKLKDLHTELCLKLRIAAKNRKHGEDDDSDCEDRFIAACLSAEAGPASRSLSNASDDREGDKRSDVPLWYQDMEKKHFEQAKKSFLSTSSPKAAGCSALNRSAFNSDTRQQRLNTVGSTTVGSITTMDQDMIHSVSDASKGSSNPPCRHPSSRQISPVAPDTPPSRTVKQHTHRLHRAPFDAASAGACAGNDAVLA